MNYITYSEGYKYQLEKDYTVKVDILGETVDTDYIDLKPDGTLIIYDGYCWDGPSGPTMDTKDFMRGALVHDALYQSMRAGKLDANKYRKVADATMRKLCREDGMSWFRAWYTYHAVRLFGSKSADPAGDYPIKTAP